MSGLREKLLQPAVSLNQIRSLSDKKQRVRSPYRYTSRQLDLWLTRLVSSRELNQSEPSSVLDMQMVDLCEEF